jgi:hypothetical protein
MALQCASRLEGANPAGVAVYDLQTGRYNDKVFLDGTVDAKVAAESAMRQAFSNWYAAV